MCGDAAEAGDMTQVALRVLALLDCFGDNLPDVWPRLAGTLTHHWTVCPLSL
jgi:hypothetical protein